MQYWLLSGDEPLFGGTTLLWHGGDAPWPAGVVIRNIDLQPDDMLGPDGLRLEADEAGQVVGWRLVDSEGQVLAAADPPELDEEQREWLAPLDGRLEKGQIASEAPGKLAVYFCARLQAHPEQPLDEEPVPEASIRESLTRQKPDVDYYHVDYLLELLDAEGEALPEFMDGEEPDAVYTLELNWSGLLALSEDG